MPAYRFILVCIAHFLVVSGHLKCHKLCSDIMHKGHIKLCFESLALLFIFSFTRLKRKKNTKFFFPLWFLTIFPSGILSF